MNCTTAQPWLDALSAGAAQAGVRLKRNQVRGFPVRAGDVIRCVAGAVWLTPGDGTDVELHAGQAFTVKQSAHAAVWAIEEATLVMT